MVQQILGKRDIGGALGRAIGSSFQQGAQDATQYAVNRSRLNEALSEFENIKNFDQMPFSKQLTAAARALLPAPGGAQVLSELLPFLQRNARASAENQLDLGGEGGAGQPGQSSTLNSKLPSFNELSAQNGMPGFRGQATPNFPNIEKAQTDYTTVPGKSTRPETVPIKTGNELMAEAQDLQRQSLNSANPLTLEQAYNIVQQRQQANVAYNQQLEQEKVANKARQQEVGAVVNDIVDKTYPGATEEERALFERWGNEAAGESEKESDIKNFVARKVNDYKAKVANVQSQISRPNWLNNVYNSLRGNAKSVDQAKTELRNLVDPLLQLGMVDKARSLVSELDWMPVETEEIVSEPLPRDLRTYIQSLPEYKKEKPASMRKVAGAGPGLAGVGVTGSVVKTPEERQQTIEGTYNDLVNIFKNYRDANLVLLRDEFEKKGVNWNEFSEALNRLYSQGDERLPTGRLIFNDDQIKQLKNVSEPPLSMLDQFLYNIGLKGK